VTLPVIQEVLQGFDDVTVRSSVDCLIAASATRHQLTVVHRDRDYASLARLVPFNAIDIRLG
jgi:predicted nucleic acid-binding protein